MRPGSVGVSIAVIGAAFAAYALISVEPRPQRSAPADSADAVEVSGGLVTEAELQVAPREPAPTSEVAPIAKADQVPKSQAERLAGLLRLLSQALPDGRSKFLAQIESLLESTPAGQGAERARVALLVARLRYAEPAVAIEAVRVHAIAVMKRSRPRDSLHMTGPLAWSVTTDAGVCPLWRHVEFAGRAFAGEEDTLARRMSKAEFRNEIRGLAAHVLRQVESLPPNRGRARLADFYQLAADVSTQVVSPSTAHAPSLAFLDKHCSSEPQAKLDPICDFVLQTWTETNLLPQRWRMLQLRK